ncbi:hypothetical protein L7F22_065317 [Adiantum nelumboides]|nr:hypothetical protein [Adiantum nelumboides]
MQTLLMIKNMWKIVMGEEPRPAYGDQRNDWDRRALQAQGLININVEDTLVKYIQSATSAKEAWDILARRFEGKSIIKVMHLKSKLNEATKSSSESVHKYLLKLGNIQDELAAIGEEVSDADMIQSTLKGIKKEYKHFVTSLAVRKSFLSLEDLTSLLFQEEERFGEENPTSWNQPSALIMHQGGRYNRRGGGKHGRVFHRNNNSRFAASSNSTPTHNTNQPFEGRRGHHHQGSRGRGNGRRTGNCYNCEIFGHWQRDCTRSPTTNGRPQITNGPSNNEVSNYASSSSNPHHEEAFLSTYMAPLQEEVEDGWYVHSGASNHMTHHHDWFTSVQPFKAEGSVLTGDDSHHAIQGKGTITFKCRKVKRRTCPQCSSCSRGAREKGAVMDSVVRLHKRSAANSASGAAGNYKKTALHDAGQSSSSSFSAPSLLPQPCRRCRRRGRRTWKPSLEVIPEGTLSEEVDDDV